MRQLDWPWRAFVSLCVLFLPLFGYAQPTDWKHWLSSQVQQHPDVLAAREQWLGANARSDVLEQPIYNPALYTDLERNGKEDNYRVGVQQTVDWWGRQDARQQQAEYLRSAAEALYQQQILDKTAEALTALVAWQAASRAATISHAQQQQLNSLLVLVEKRQQAGDVGSTDAELTFLSLSQQLAQLAGVEAELAKAEAKLRELLPRWTPEWGAIPEHFWSAPADSATDQVLLTHPVVASAFARWLSLKQDVEVTRRSAKAEPTVGLNAGHDSGENVVGLTFSIPLNVRNNFSAETRAAERSALEAEARFQAIYRKQRFDWQAAYAAWERFAQQNNRWQTLVQSRIENSAELLHRQWRSGDLPTTDYLLALNQRAESLRSGIELEKQTRLALTAVLQHSGQLMAAIMPATTSINE